MFEQSVAGRSDTHELLCARRWSSTLLLAAVFTLLGVSGVHAATVVRVASFEYDSTTGLLTKETVEPDDPTYRVDTTYTYDNFGNQLSKTTSGSGVANRTTSTTYDAQGRFALTTTNNLGQTNTRTFDAKFGGVLTVTDPNGLTATNQFDNWGRLTQSVAPDGSAQQHTYLLEAEGFQTCVTSSTAPEYCQVSDRLGRPRYVIRRTFQGDLTLMEQRTHYDLAGRPYLHLRTAEDGPVGPGGDIFPGSSGGVASFYDASGRVIAVRDVDSVVDGVLPSSGSPLKGLSVQCAPPSCLETTYTYGYDTNSRQTWVRSTDPKGQQETRYSDFAGRLVKVVDALGNSTTFSYTATGQLKESVDPFGNVSSISYNKRGEKVSSSTPDMGTWTYQYNVYGELVQQTDAKAQVTTMAYDGLGRLVQRSEPEMTSYWRYDSYRDGSACAEGIGRLCSAWVSNGYERKLVYDAYGRSSSVSIQVDGTWYNTGYGYDGNGRLATLTYPNGFAVTYVYDAWSHQSKVVRNDTGATIYEVQSDHYAPAVGSHREYKAVFGDGYQEQRIWDKHGRPTATTYLNASDVLTRTQQLTYDDAGNVASRFEATEWGGFTENYSYDALNRMTASYGADVPDKVYQYDAIGNLTFKTGAGNYSYPASGSGSVRPHAVSSISGTVQDGITGASYAYDANGNMTSGGGHVMTWTSFDRVKRLSQTWWGDWFRTFTYNGEYERVKAVGSDPQYGTQQAIYINPGSQQSPFFETSTGFDASTRVYISFGGRPVSQVRTTDADGVMQYHLLTDAQGSIFSESAYGNTTQDLAYDPWGKTRNPDDGSDYGLPPDGGWAWHTNRGYTGHEIHQDQNVINMNGRLYDPVLSRMMSADPFVPGGGNNPQGYNRYAYAFNNPMRYTDPDGFRPIWQQQWFRTVAAVAVAIWAPQAMGTWMTDSAVAGGSTAFAGLAADELTYATLTPAGFAAAGAAGGFAGGLIASGGNLQAAAAGGLTGAAFGWAGSLGSTNAKIMGHAAAGCLSGVVQGGGCGRGAASAVVGKVVTIELGKASRQIGAIGEFTAASVAGGVTSVVAGGRFAAGATTAAFGYLFNECNHRGCWESVKEYALRVAGDAEGYWAAKCAGGEPFSCTALGVVRNDTLLGKAANFRLKSFAAQHGLSVDLHAVNVDFMNAYGSAQAATSSELNPQLPSVRNIESEHYLTFERFGLGPNTFGGTPFEGTALRWLTVPSSIWCNSCAR